MEGQKLNAPEVMWQRSSGRLNVAYNDIFHEKQFSAIIHARPGMQEDRHGQILAGSNTGFRSIAHATDRDRPWESPTSSLFNEPASVKPYNRGGTSGGFPLSPSSSPENVRGSSYSPSLLHTRGIPEDRVQQGWTLRNDRQSPCTPSGDDGGSWTWDTQQFPRALHVANEQRGYRVKGKVRPLSDCWERRAIWL